MFFYVSRAQVDLSLFNSDQASLIQSLRAAHRSIRFQPLSHDRKATIEGPFAAIKALREDLIRRASQLKSTVPTGTITLRESPPNPTVISHHKFLDSVSCSGSKAKLKPAASNGLSALQQSTGEAAEVQSLLSNAKTHNSASQNVQSFCDPDTDEEEELKAGSRLKLTTKYSTEGAKTKTRQLSREEMNAGIRSSSSGPEVDGISQKHSRTDTMSAAETVRSTHLDSHYLKGMYQSTSSVTNTKPKDVSLSWKSSAGETEDLSAGCSEDPEGECIWVDSNIFRYIEKLDKKEYDRCLSGLYASVEEAKGSDLVRICLTEMQPSLGSFRVQRALEKLKTLVEDKQSTLRVHEVCYKKGEHSKHKLIQICKEANFADMYDDVLYIVEDSSIKVVGPSISSFLFYKRLERSLNIKRPVPL